jgi:hypothetical protein
LNIEELVDWVSTMDKYFGNEEVDKEKRVKFSVARLRAHASLCWDGVQAKRKKNEKVKIANWNRMFAKLKGNFLPNDYHLSLFKQM